MSDNTFDRLTITDSDGDDLTLKAWILDRRYIVVGISQLDPPIELETMFDLDRPQIRQFAERIMALIDAPAVTR